MASNGRTGSIPVRGTWKLTERSASFLFGLPLLGTTCSISTTTAQSACRMAIVQKVAQSVASKNKHTASMPYKSERGDADADWGNLGMVLSVSVSCHWLRKDAGLWWFHLVDYLEYFGWGYHERFLWKMLYVTCHEVRVFHRESDLVEYDVFRVRELRVRCYSIWGDTAKLNLGLPRTVAYSSNISSL